MILDKYLEMCDATAFAGGTGRQLLGSQIGIGGSAPNLGDHSMPLFLVIQVTTTVTSGGSATVQFELSSDATAAIAVDGSASVHYTSADIPKATLVAGYEIAVPLPMAGGIPYEAYLGLVANVGTAALTAGNINAFLTPQPNTWKAYPDAAN